MTQAAQQQPNRCPLTDRELQTVRLIARQFTDKQIALEMGVSQATVKNHNYNAKLKLKIVSRVGLALWYVQQYGFPDFSLRYDRNLGQGGV